MEMLLPRQFLNRRPGFRFQGRGDDDPGDAMAGNELRQVAHSAQHPVPINPVEMQRRLIVDQPDNSPAVKAQGVVKAAFPQEELTASTRPVKHHPFRVRLRVAG